MIRKYETVILFDTEVSEDTRKEFLAKLAAIIVAYKGEVLKQDDWGTRRLAYTINKKVSAFYTFLFYTGDRGVVEEVERNIKIIDGVLRHMTTLCTAEVKAKVAPAPVQEEAPAIPPDATPAPPAPVVE
ncbi:MAG TPA: 30S ribosomal protein S6 [Candidatus Deferrimicrobiaceae bacterium]|jgi:small subunit ribosomal protein S6